jgi:hypothetical protein
MRNVVRSHRVTYRKPDGIIRLTKIMREQIEQLIAELEAKVDGLWGHINECRLMGWEFEQYFPVIHERNNMVDRLTTILADSKPVSADLGTVDRVGDSE